MRIGLDIATITLKKQANVIILVSGDSDFVPAAKLARREGITFILDPLWQNVSADLREHIDGLTSGFRRPVSRRARSQRAWMNDMASDHAYCHRCGARMGRADVGGKSRPKCGDCGAVVFLDPKVAVVVVASCDDEILMVKRDIEPMFGKWAFPSGYVDRFEPVEEAAVREVREETGVEVRLDALLGVYSQRGAPVILVAYSASIVGGVLTAGDEAQDARMFPSDALPHLPFPHDGEIIAAWGEWVNQL